ncbi:hypothetical protein PGTUg99_014501 [Puccinia graminis f. sp. tritici]|uniref:Uncharacterized protein n=1 Tax=Puccinia graminis f. sp. tritici TaxID=56615 RepID=A0A5B0NKC5_PUCGR|nr:hypothetical protein PGTUg99_014501 [Puccinia graminis f. sp. tritici]
MPRLMLSYDKLVRLGLVSALFFLGHLVLIASGMQQGNAGRTCHTCDAHYGRLRLLIPSGQENSQHPVHPQRHGSLPCSIFQTKGPCHRSIPFQLHYCNHCTMYAWVPTGKCLDHPRPQPGPVYCNSDNIDLLRQRAAAAVDTTLQLGH